MAPDIRRPKDIFVKDVRFMPVQLATVIGEKSRAWSKVLYFEQLTGSFDDFNATGVLHLVCDPDLEVPIGEGSFEWDEWINVIDGLDEIRWGRYISHSPNDNDTPHIIAFTIEKGISDIQWSARVTLQGYYSHLDYEYGQQIVLKIPSHTEKWYKRFVGVIQGIEWSENYDGITTILICYSYQYYLANQVIPETRRTNWLTTDPAEVEYPNGSTGIDSSEDDWIVLGLRRKLIDPSILVREYHGGVYRGKGTGVEGSNEVLSFTGTEQFQWQRRTGVCPLYILPVPGEDLIPERKTDFYRYTKSQPFGFAADTTCADAIKEIADRYKYIYDVRMDLILAILPDADPVIYDPDNPDHADAEILEDTNCGFFIPYERLDELLTADPVTINFSDKYVLSVDSKPYQSAYYNKVTVAVRDYTRLLYFKTCTSRHFAGQIVHGGSSGATATILGDAIMQGTVGVDGRGYLYLDTDCDGNFEDGETLVSLGAGKDTGASICLESATAWEALDTRSTVVRVADAVLEETEKASEMYIFLDGPQYTLDVAEDVADTLYDYYSDRIQMWTVRLANRSDLMLWQKVLFLGWDTLPASQMRIIRMKYIFEEENDVPTVTVEIDIMKDLLFQRQLEVNARTQTDQLSEIEATIRDYLKKNYGQDDIGTIKASQGNMLLVSDSEGGMHISYK